MAVLMRSAQFRSIVEPILNEEFDGIYDIRKDEWKGLFREETGTKRQYHEEPVLFGFGAAPEVQEGAPVTYDAGGVLFIKRYYYRVYGLAFGLTKVLVEDGDHIRIGRMFSKHLANALIETKETLTANVLNRSFNGNFPGGDGVALIANNHPIQGGTFSNLLATPAALSQTSLEQMLIQIRQSAVDNNGKKIKLTPQKLVVHSNNMFQAEVILNTVLRPGSANNDINPIKSQSMLPGGQHVISRLTSTTAWWIQTDATEGLKIMTRRSVEKSMEGDFETDSMKYKATERYAVGFTDPRCLYGTPGI
jgi:hypothetical protein